MKSILKRSISYAKMFRLMEGLVFAPLMGLVGQMLRGRVVVDSTALVGFLLSPRGFSAAMFAAMSLLLIRMTEQAGLSVLRAEEFGGPCVSPVAAFKFVLHRILPLLRAAARFIILAGGILAPFLIATGFIARHLLSRHDINFYLAERPADFLFWAAGIAGLALITVGVLVWNMIRWRWVVHVILFENKADGAAFKRSAELVKGTALMIALQWGAIGLLNVALGVVAAWIGRLILPLGVGLLGSSIRSLGVLLGCLLVLQALIGATVLTAGPIVEALIFTRWYFKRSGTPLSGRTDQILATPPYPITAPPWVFAVVLLALVSLGGVAGGIWGTQALSLDRPVKIIAHKGSVNDAPENSLPAIERAILDGADVAEIDVQVSRDGVVVLAHDSDFSRMAGIAKKVSDLTWNEIKKINIGSGMRPEFSGVLVPRLEQALAVARGRIRLNIELKHYGDVDERLERRVVELIHQSGVVDQFEIQSLEYEALMAVRRLEPALRIGYLLSVNARDTDRLEVDFLSAQASRVDVRFIRNARRNGQSVYVWTVDKLDDMERMIDLGVDGLITNQSRAASQLLHERRSMSPHDKALARIRTWLAR